MDSSWELKGQISLPVPRSSSLQTAPAQKNGLYLRGRKIFWSHDVLISCQLSSDLLSGHVTTRWRPFCNYLPCLLKRQAPPPLSQTKAMFISCTPMKYGVPWFICSTRLSSDKTSASQTKQQVRSQLIHI